MKAILFTKPGLAELLEQDEPVLGPGAVRVRLCVSTVSSGTERANLIGEKNISINPNDCTEVRWPRRAGYSSSGIVEAVGEGVSSVAPGDRVALSWSSHSEICVLPEKNVHHIPAGISFEEAALWHIATFPSAAIRKCRLSFGESALVMGQGVLGKFAVKLLHAAGAVPVIAVDPVPAKREQALANGADYAFDPFDPAFAQNVKRVTNGGANVAIEVTGSGKGLDGALDCMARFGRIALLGCTRHSDFTIDYYHKVHGPGITLIGAHTLARPSSDSSDGWWTERDDILAIIRMAQYGRLSLLPLVEEAHSPAEAEAVYARLANDSFFPLVQFDWRRL